MGTDIHLHIEVKFDNEWKHYGCPGIDRHYDMFAIMADVRNYDNKRLIAQPKGLPKNLTELTKRHYDYWELDAHDESWLDIEEIIELENRIDEYTNDDRIYWIEQIFKTFLFNNSLTGWYKYPQDNQIGIKDLRFVFWFDN